MSDDDRMERAKRIRRMREGQRTNGKDQAGDTNGESADATEMESDEVESGDSDDAESGDPDDADETESTDTDEWESLDEGDESGQEATDQGEPVAGDPGPAASQDDAEPATSQDGADAVADDSAEQSQEDTMNETSLESETDESNTDTGTSGGDASDPAAIAERAAKAAASVTGASEAVEVAAESSTTSESPSPGVTESMAGSTTVQLPDQEQIEAAVGGSGTAEAGDDQEDTPSPSGVESQTSTEESKRVLEFTLGDEHYCIDISLVEEIVKRDSITRVPNTDDYIEGVVDLRGQITTILDPKDLLDIDQDGRETLMIVFDPEAFDDQGAIGWIVDQVRQVAPIRESDVNDPPVHEDYIRGVVDRDDEEEFVIWTKPEVAIELATVDEDEG